MPNITTDDVAVLIVGAGPTGLTLGCDLARRGVHARVIERSPQAFCGSRGKGLQPRTLEVFDDLGIVADVLASGTEYPRLKVHYGWLAFPWQMMEKSERSPDVPYPNPCLLPQANTEGILRARLAALGGNVDFDTELVGFEQDAHGVFATSRRAGAEHTVRCAYLIGADGGRSFVRKQLGIPFAGTSLDEPIAIVGDVRVDGLDRHYWHVWPRARGGAVAFCPLPDGVHFQLFAQLPAGAEVPELDVPHVREHVARAIGKADLALSDASWLSVYRPQSRMVDSYRSGRVLLAGDAAHVHPPTGGQGLNIGVQDAYNLGWKLASVLSGAPQGLLDSYEEERKPIASDVLGLSTALYQQGAKRQRRGDATKQLGMNYRTRSLSTELRAQIPDAAPRAGDRAPDAPFTARDGSSRRLFDLFRGAHFSALVFDADVAEHVASAAPACRVFRVARSSHTAAAGVIDDTSGQVAASYGASPGDVLVIRPDGYLGLCASRPSADVLRVYFAQFVAG